MVTLRSPYRADGHSPHRRRGRAGARPGAAPARRAFRPRADEPPARAGQTCALAGLGARAEIGPDLAEWDYGEYEGKISAEIRRDDPGWNIFEHGCPGGETPRQTADRADRLSERLAASPGTIALFSHGHFGSALAVRWIGLDIGTGAHFWLETASIGILGHHPSRPETRILSRWNLVLPPPGP